MKWFIPLVIVGVILTLLYNIFTSTHLSSDGVWLLISIAIIIILVILFVRYRSSLPSFSGVRLPSVSFSGFTFWKILWKTILVISLTIVVILVGVYLYASWKNKDYGEKPHEYFKKPVVYTESSGTKSTVPQNEEIHEGDNNLVAGIAYQFDKQADTEYNFFHKAPGSSILTLTLAGSNEYVKGKINQHGFYPIEGADPDKNGYYLVMVEESCTVKMTVRKIN